MKSPAKTFSIKPLGAHQNFARITLGILLTIAAAVCLISEQIHAQESVVQHPSELVAQFFPGIETSQLSIHDELAYGDTEWVLADPGKVYFAHGKAVDKIGVKGLPGGVWKLSWCDVQTGERFDQQIVAISGGDYTFGKPDNIGNHALVYIYNARDAWTPPGVK